MLFIGWKEDKEGGGLDQLTPQAGRRESFYPAIESLLRFHESTSSNVAMSKCLGAG